MLPVLDKLDKIGYYSLECWGGATYDSCLRFLNEDPWDRLRTIREHCPNTKLQMLFRGQNMLGYRHYADDCVEYLVQRSIANGIDIIRIFDALNDIKNLKTAIKAANKEGGHAQVAISYTTGPVFTDEYYVEYAKRIADAGADSICIKDMAALLTPTRTESLVKAIKAAVPELPLQLHTHYTSGLASMCLLKGVEAGADGIDTAISPLALGTSHAPTESMVAALSGTEFDTGLDLKQFSDIRAYFMTLREKYIKSGLLDPKMLATDANALIYQVPGGMLSNLLSQLKQAGKEDKLDEVLAEVPRVRKDSGYPPLVTPTSQIVGTQAVFNVITGKRYSMCTNEFKGLVAGEYGTTQCRLILRFRRRLSVTRRLSKAVLQISLSLSLISFVARLSSGLNSLRMFFLMHSSRRLLSTSLKREEMPRLASTATSLTRKIWFTLFDLTTKINIYATFINEGGIFCKLKLLENHLFFC